MIVGIMAENVTQTNSLTRPRENQSLVDFRAQLPKRVIQEEDHYPEIVTAAESETNGDKRPMWIVAGERHQSYLKGRPVDALDFYVGLGCDIVGLLEVDQGRGIKKEPFYMIKLPNDGTVGICNKPDSRDYFLIHDQMGQVQATSTVRLHYGPMGGRIATGYLIEEGTTRR